MSVWEACGGSDEWYTPKYVFDLLGLEFDMDVASPSDLTYVSTPAKKFISCDSLETEWVGTIWMNPPFAGRKTKSLWLAKFFDHGNGVALTPDRTSAPWFREAWMRADLVLFTPKIKFIDPTGAKGASPSNGTALWAAGPHAVAALQQAARKGLGILAQPMK